MSPTKLSVFCATATLLVLSTTTWAQDYSVDWYSVDGGGELLSETADQQWQLSGTIGQPDGTESLALSGNGWTLTGGFWPVTVDETDLLFRDGFEGDAAGSSRSALAIVINNR